MKTEFFSKPIDGSYLLVYYAHMNIYSYIHNLKCRKLAGCGRPYIHSVRLPEISGYVMNNDSLILYLSSKRNWRLEDLL